jgi:glycosyltransferase involved in cell wall biosynthesis
VSNSTKQELISKFGFKKENIEVIENACDLIPIQEVDFTQKQNKILFLGRLMPIKRVEHAILAFYNFIKSDDKFSNYSLDIV